MQKIVELRPKLRPQGWVLIASNAVFMRKASARAAWCALLMHAGLRNIRQESLGGILVKGIDRKKEILGKPPEGKIALQQFLTLGFTAPAGLLDTPEKAAHLPQGLLFPCLENAFEPR